MDSYRFVWILQIHMILADCYDSYRDSSYESWYVPSTTFGRIPGMAPDMIPFMFAGVAPIMISNMMSCVNASPCRSSRKEGPRNLPKLNLVKALKPSFLIRRPVTLEQVVSQSKEWLCEPLSTRSFRFRISSKTNPHTLFSFALL